MSNDPTIPSAPLDDDDNDAPEFPEVDADVFDPLEGVETVDASPGLIGRLTRRLIGR